MIEVAIVSEQAPGFRELATGAGIHVAADAPRVEELIALGGRYDVVLLDLTGSGGPRDITRAASIGRPLVSDRWQRLGPVAAVRAGAAGCVRRAAPRPILVEALTVLAGGGFYLCPQLLGRFRSELADDGTEESRSLAPREIETLKFIASGYTHAQIAARMGLTRATVSTYARRIRTKLNVRNQTDLVRVAAELGHHPAQRR